MKSSTQYKVQAIKTGCQIAPHVWVRVRGVSQAYAAIGIVDNVGYGLVLKLYGDRVLVVDPDDIVAVEASVEPSDSPLVSRS